MNSPLLNGINSPIDLRKLPEADLPLLSQEIREELIGSLSETGGHLGPNLGVVELSIALHRVFETPKDKILFDVSHQGYVHKILTGRRNRMSSMRQHGGLNGFLLRTESEHDCYGAGHAGTALSAALGMAAARDMNGGSEHIVAVAGDAAFTCGVSYEALNNVAETTKRFIVILNDNQWSIARNTGAIAEHLNRIATSPAYEHLHDQAAKFVEWIGGKTARKLAHKIKSGVKQIIGPSVIFENLGLRYFGPIDGHDIPLLIRTFEFLKTLNEPVLLHIMTKKGKGYGPAVEKPDKFHGLGKYQPDTGETVSGLPPTYSEIFGKTLSDFADHNRKIVAITAAMPNGTGLTQYATRHPDRFYDVGIAEEHAALFAAGMATRGMKPFLTIYSTFMQRAFDMIVHDIALQHLNVGLCMDRAGLSGDDGPTHHGLFDIAYLRSIPGLIQMQPKDEEEFADMLWTMANHHEGPVAIRYPRGAGTGAVPRSSPRLLEIGKAEVLRHGSDVALFGLGNFCEVALGVADLLQQQGIKAAVINPRWIKPLDVGTLEFFARGTKLICTLEDHAVTGGFGTAVSEHLTDLGITTPLVRIGWPDQFIEHGSVAILRAKYGMTAPAIAEKILQSLKLGQPTNQETHNLSTNLR
ncbi:MAG: 1-deoxy-D-xylulose-5-phosphate synthase [Verrucomicrobia bacterium]|nr:MAG: 1-deoxy-D-xylulose-5-phosphate synthase [Verrucomicrobiota bacterium]